MAISYDTLNKLQWCNLNPNDTLVDLEDSSFEGLYNGGWSTRPNLPPTITLSDTINFVLDKKSSFAVKQLGEFLKSQDVSLTDIDEVPNTALKDAIAKASNKYIDGRIVQVTGQNKDKIMSQKAVTDYMKSMSDDIDNNLKVKLDSLQTEVDNVSIVANDAIPNSKKTSELGTSTDLVATQKLVNDVNTKAVNAQTKADQAHTLATTANTTANTANTTANNAIPNSKKTSELGTSTDLVATQKLVNDVSEIALFASSVIGIGNDTNILIKSNLYSTIFEKNSPSSIKIKSGTVVNHLNKSHNISNKIVNMGDKQKGNDYVVIITSDGSLKIEIDKFESPYSLKTGEMIIGGFFYSEVPEDATTSNGGFATTGNGMIWKQSDVDKIKGINEFSFWDLRFRAGGIINSPRSIRHGQLSNHGMVFDRNTNMWFAIYHVSSDVDKYGISRSGTNMASGTVLPLIPSAYNGDGIKKYENLNWWNSNEILNSHGARLLWEYEFNSRAFGTTENKVAGGSGTYPKTERIVGLTSKLGCEQVTGVHWYWGLDSSYRYDDASWSNKDVTGGRGNPYTQGTYGLVRAIFGGNRAFDASIVGSRCVYWHLFPWDSGWHIGALGARDLIII